MKNFFFHALPVTDRDGGAVAITFEVQGETGERGFANALYFLKTRRLTPPEGWQFKATVTDCPEEQRAIDWRGHMHGAEMRGS